MHKRTLILLLGLCLFIFKETKEMTPVYTNQAPILYLTFDDGPNQYTKKILDILDAYGIKATFFVTGQQEEYAYLIKEAKSRGHTIGLHCFRHEYDVIYESVEDYLEDLEKISELVESQIGQKSYFLRFPGGSSNQVSQVDMHTLIDEITQRGYRYFDWNVESGDARKNCTIYSVLHTSLYLADGKRDIMLLCHDKEIMVEVLPTIIDYYYELGYVFLPITMDTSGFCHLK